MNHMWFGCIPVSEEQSSVLNGLLILILVPLFTRFVYPYFEKREQFKLIDRMIAGMVLVALSSVSIGIIQHFIDRDTTMLVQTLGSEIIMCDQTDAGKCMSGQWQFISYFLLTCGEVLFSISGINLAYQEVGARTKASATSFWLVTIAFGNFIVLLQI